MNIGIRKNKEEIKPRLKLNYTARNVNKIRPYARGMYERLKGIVYIIVVLVSHCFEI